MRVGSAKAKGRRLQQTVCSLLTTIVGCLEEDDIRSTAMGQSGEDIQFSPLARRYFPWSIECKNVEKLSIWSAIEQARDNNMKENIPMVVFKKNHENTQISLPLEYFLEIYKGYLDAKES